MGDYCTSNFDPIGGMKTISTGMLNFVMENGVLCSVFVNMVLGLEQQVVERIDFQDSNLIKIYRNVLKLMHFYFIQIARIYYASIEVNELEFIQEYFLENSTWMNKGRIIVDEQNNPLSLKSNSFFNTIEYFTILISTKTILLEWTNTIILKIIQLEINIKSNYSSTKSETNISSHDTDWHVQLRIFFTFKTKFKRESLFFTQPAMHNCELYSKIQNWVNCRPAWVFTGFNALYASKKFSDAPTTRLSCEIFILKSWRLISSSE